MKKNITMIFICSYLILVVEFAISEVPEIGPKDQIIQLHQTKRHKTRPYLRINNGRQNDEKWDHISDSLVKFLDCIGPAASHIPPITIGKYKLTVINCLANGYSVKGLQKDSENALEKEVPSEIQKLLKCYSKIDPEDEDKISDEKSHIAQIIQCSNEGNILKATQKLKNKTLDTDRVHDNKKEESSKKMDTEGNKISDTAQKENSDEFSDEFNKTLHSDTVQENIQEENKEKFAASFRKCILESTRSSHESKVMECMDTFKENKLKFYIKYSPANIESKTNYSRYHYVLRNGLHNKKCYFRASEAIKSARVLAVIIIHKKLNKRAEFTSPRNLNIH